MSRLTRDGTAEPVSRDQVIRRELEAGDINFLCSADHEQDWQLNPVDIYSPTYMLCVARTARRHVSSHTLFAASSPLSVGVCYVSLTVCQFVASAEGHATGAMSCFFFTQPGRDGKILCDHRQDGNDEVHRL